MDLLQELCMELTNLAKKIFYLISIIAALTLYKIFFNSRDFTLAGENRLIILQKLIEYRCMRDR